MDESLLMDDVGAFSPDAFAKHLQGAMDTNNETASNEPVNLPKEARRVAETMERGTFTCQHVVAALRVTPDWDRGALVRRLLDQCVDFEENKGLVEAELTEWEQNVTANAFRKAHEQRSRESPTDRGFLSGLFHL